MERQWLRIRRYGLQSKANFLADLFRRRRLNTTTESWTVTAFMPFDAKHEDLTGIYRSWQRVADSISGLFAFRNSCECALRKLQKINFVTNDKAEIAKSMSVCPWVSNLKVQITFRRDAISSRRVLPRSIVWFLSAIFVFGLTAYKTLPDFPSRIICIK